MQLQDERTKRIKAEKEAGGLRTQNVRLRRTVLLLRQKKSPRRPETKVSFVRASRRKSALTNRNREGAGAPSERVAEVEAA